MLYPNLGVNSLGHLTVAGEDTLLLAQTYGTPLLVMDEAALRRRCRTYVSAMNKAFPAGSMPIFASKALSFKGMYTIMQQENMGVDVSSPGELYTAYRAGFPMEKAFFHGNNKTDEDISLAMDCGLGYFICDNRDELQAINREAGRRGLRQKLLLRLTPGIDPHTHAKINTGRVDSKFGAAIETGQARELTQMALSMEHVELAGLHCHIGSQIFDHEPFCDAARIMMDFLEMLRNDFDYQAKILNLGGGMAVPYTQEDPSIDYEKNICHIGQLLEEICSRKHMAVPQIIMEPGRSIVADAGLTLYTVGSTKKIPGFKNYASIDGGMTDNPRYTLYGSAYTVLPAGRMNENRDFVCTVAGRCCESGDLIQEDVSLPEPVRGDILAVLTTGAYNFSMASNYNRLPRPALIMLGEKGPYVAVRRESLDDLIKNDM